MSDKWQPDDEDRMGLHLSVVENNPRDQMPRYEGPVLDAIPHLIEGQSVFAWTPAACGSWPWAMRPNEVKDDERVTQIKIMGNWYVVEWCPDCYEAWDGEYEPWYPGR